MHKRLLTGGPVVALCLILVAGCAAIGDFVVPPHRSSNWDGKDVMCIDVRRGPFEETGAAAGILLDIATPVAGWAYDKVVDAIEVEAGRYKASYTGRSSFDLYETEAGKKQLKVVNLISVKRLILSGKGATPHQSLADLKGQTPCTIDPEKLPSAFSADFKLEVRRADQGLEARIVPQGVLVRGSKAKAMGLSWWRPWSVVTIVDKSFGRVDFSIHVKLSAAVYSDKGVRQDTDLVAVDFPVGKLDLRDDPVSLDLSNQPSAWFALPPPAISPGAGCALTSSPAAAKKGNAGAATKSLCGAKTKFGPASIEVTISESNDLGDILAKQAASAEKKKDENVKKIVDELRKAVDE